MGKKNKITFINISFKNRRTQDLKNYYYDAAQFYIGKIYAWKNYNISSKIGVEIPE